MRTPFRALMVALLTLSVAPGVVAAHAQLVTSTPAVDAVLASLPPAIVLTFDDPILPSVAGLAIVGAGLAWFLRRRRAT